MNTCSSLAVYLTFKHAVHMSSSRLRFLRPSLRKSRRVVQCPDVRHGQMSSCPSCTKVMGPHFREEVNLAGIPLKSSSPIVFPSLRDQMESNNAFFHFKICMLSLRSLCERFQLTHVG